MFWMMDFMATIYLVWALAEGTSPSVRRARLVALILLSLSAVRGVYLKVVEFPERAIARFDIREDDWGRAMAWARETDTRSGWLADPGHAVLYGTSVRVAAGRDVLVEAVKDAAIGMYDRRVAIRTRDRIAAVGDFGALTADRAREIGSTYDLDYLIAEQELDLPWPFRVGSSGYIACDSVRSAISGDSQSHASEAHSRPRGTVANNLPPLFSRSPGLPFSRPSSGSNEDVVVQLGELLHIEERRSLLVEEPESGLLDFCDGGAIICGSAVEFDEQRLQPPVSQRPRGAANDLCLDSIDVDLDVGGERVGLEFEEAVERKGDASLLKGRVEGTLLPVERIAEAVHRFTRPEAGEVDVIHALAIGQGDRHALDSVTEAVEKDVLIDQGVVL
jgi:hypothetical protein